MKVYLDRNILGDLKSSSRSHTRLLPLQDAVKQKRIDVLFSTTILEETLPALNHSAAMLREEIEVIRSLVHTDRMIKTPAELLEETIQSYALNRSLPDMFIPTPPFLRKLFDEGIVSEQVKEYLRGHIALTEKFSPELTEAFERARKAVQEQDVGKPKYFREFYDGFCPAILEQQRRNYGVYDACMERGTNGLMETKTIKLYLLYYAAWVYAKLFGEQGVSGKVDPSERGDWFHAVQAAASDVFVTHDGRLARWLNLRPVNDFEILTLLQLIERVS